MTHKKETKEHKLEPKTEKPQASAETVPKTEYELLKKQIVEQEDKYLRMYAEFDNFRKRSELEKSDFAKFANKNFIEAILPVLDSFEHSRVAFERKTENMEELQKGFALIHKQFEDILLKFGVKKIEAKGQKFDPKFHEAVMQKEVEGTESQTVVEELQPGFTLHDRLLRPSMVIVAK